MLSVQTLRLLKLESVYLVTTKTGAPAVIPESGLEQEGTTMTPTRAEMKLDPQEIMERST